MDFVFARVMTRADFAEQCSPWNEAAFMMWCDLKPGFAVLHKCRSSLSMICCGICETYKAERSGHTFDLHLSEVSRHSSISMPLDSR